MSKSQLVSHGLVSVVDNTTRFFAITGPMTGQTVEEYSQQPIRDAGTFANLYVRIPTNTASNTSTVTLRKNKADTALIVTIGSDLTGVFEDNSNTVAFANTDEANLEVTVPTEAGTNNLTISLFGMSFTPDTTTNAATFLNTNAAVGNITGDSTTLFITPQGTNAVASVEANNQIKIRGSFVAQDFNIYVSANARTSDSTFGTRKNTAAGSQSVVVGAGLTGFFEDTSNTDTLAANDLYGYYVTTGAGTGEATAVREYSSTLISTANQFLMVLGDLLSQAFNVTNYLGASGSSTDETTTEADTQIIPQFTFTVKELITYRSANSIATSDSSVTVRDGGADSAVTVVIPTGAGAAWQADSTNSTVITAATDTLNIKVVTPNTSGTLSLRQIILMGEVAAAGSLIKTKKGLAVASVKTFKGLAIASVKTDKGLA